MLWGSSRGFPRTVQAPAAARPPWPRLVQPPRPALSGGGTRRAAILEGFSCRRRCSTFLPPRKGRWGRRCASDDFCPLPFPSAKPDRKGCLRKVLQDPPGKAANGRLSAPPPRSFPTGVAAIFPQHKMAARGPDWSPTRNWGYRESSRMRPRPPPLPVPVVGAVPAQRVLRPLR